jgi:hypothetical protein
MTAAEADLGVSPCRPAGHPRACVPIAARRRPRRGRRRGSRVRSITTLREVALIGRVPSRWSRSRSAPQAAHETRTLLSRGPSVPASTGPVRAGGRRSPSRPRPDVRIPAADTKDARDEPYRREGPRTRPSFEVEGRPVRSKPDHRQRAVTASCASEVSPLSGVAAWECSAADSGAGPADV